MRVEKGIVAAYELEILVDHNQFFVEDCEREWGDDDLNLLYNDDALASHLGVATGVVSVFTAKWYGIVRLEILLRSDQPEDDFTGWDNAAEASLDLPSGCLVVSGPESFPPSTPRISIPPGTYRARVYSGGVDTVDKYMQKGEDHYRVVLWPAPMGRPRSCMRVSVIVGKVMLCDPDLQPFYARLGLRPATGMLLRNYDRQAGVCRRCHDGCSPCPMERYITARRIIDSSIGRHVSSCPRARLRRASRGSRARGYS